jgi:peptidoglycan hydrolase-like protein with peptidoglycan-binding domain
MSVEGAAPSSSSPVEPAATDEVAAETPAQDAAGAEQEAPPASEEPAGSAEDMVESHMFAGNALRDGLARAEDRRAAGAGGADGASAIADAHAKPLNPNAPPLEFIEKGGAVARRGQTGEGVKQIQAALNTQGAKPPLPEDGKFDEKTEAAVKAFQKSQGLSEDGRVGPDTLGRLIPNETSIEKDPRFARLDPATKADVKARLKANAGDYAARAGIAGLATNDGFAKLSPDGRKSALETLGKAPKDRALAGELAKLSENGNFQKVDPKTQSLAFGKIGEHPADPAARATIEKLAGTPGFAALPADRRQLLLNEVGGNINMGTFTSQGMRAGLDKVMNDPTFQSADAAGQAAKLKTFAEDQKWGDWATPSNFWNGKTRPATIASGPTPEPAGKFWTDPSKPADKYEIQVAGKKVPVYLPQGAPPERLEEVRKAMEALPDSSLDAVHEIRVQPNASPEGEPAGTPTKPGDLVNLYPGFFSSFTEQQRKSALVHESSHAVSWQAWGGDISSPKWDEWKSAMAKDVTYANAARKGVETEDFSEARTVYEMVRGTPQEKEFRAMMPERFRILDKMYGRSPNETR